jgi:hypothetical protein
VGQQRFDELAQPGVDAARVLEEHHRARLK